MKNILNQALFKHRASATVGFNNLCTIIHQIRTEGVYYGEVERDKQLLGTFTLRFDKKLPAHEVHIDAAKFDPLFDKDQSGPQLREGLEVGGQGYVVLFTSGAHAGLRIKLYRRDETKAELSYDTANLAAGDIVVFRLWMPGTYRIQHSKESHHMKVSVRPSEDGKYPAALGKLAPVNVKLTLGGFELAQTETWPLQALLIHNEIAGALSLELLEEAQKNVESAL